MANTPYERGKIKVVWIEDDPEKIYSKMFDTEKKAKKFAKGKKDCLVFILENQSNMEEFSWKLLPYGRYKLYLRLIGSLHTRKINILKKIKNAF